MADINNKRQITAVFGATLEEHFFSPQIIYQDKTKACLPRTRFPSDWHVTYTPKHWANEVTTLDYIQKIILPYISKKQKEKGLSDEQHALCIFDNFKAQLTTEVLDLLEKIMLIQLSSLQTVPTVCSHLISLLTNLLRTF